jgi:hypothetical protein
MCGAVRYFASEVVSGKFAGFFRLECVMVAVQRHALQLPPRRAAKTVKMPTISRAEGGQLQHSMGGRSLPTRETAPSAV